MMRNELLAAIKLQEYFIFCDNLNFYMIYEFDLTSRIQKHLGICSFTDNRQSEHIAVLQQRNKSAAAREKAHSMKEMFSPKFLRLQRLIQPKEIL